MATPCRVVLVCLIVLLGRYVSYAQWVQTNGPYGGSTMALATSGSHIFAGIRGAGIYHSTDNGMHWSQVNSGLTNLYLWALLFDGTNLFAGTEEGGAFLTTDLGVHWTAINAGFPKDPYVFAFARIGTNLYAGTRDGVFLSTNNGTDWTPVNSGLTNTFVRALVARGSSLFAGTEGGVFRSTNRGASWASFNTGLPLASVWALATRGDDLFAGSRYGHGVYRSTDSVATWTPVTSGLRNHYVVTFASDSTSLLAGTFGGGVFRTTDNGANWTPCGPAGHFAWAVTCNAAYIFAGTAGGIFRSSDKGATWTEVDSGITHSYISALTALGNDLFASADGNGIARSTDNGNTWTPVNEGMLWTVVECLAGSGDDLFAGAWEGGVYLSINHGASWRSVNAGLTNYLVTSLLTDGTDVFVGTFGGVFRTTDRGATWVLASSGLPDASINALAANDTYLFAGTGGRGVYRSTDHGANWTPANAGISDVGVEALGVYGTNLLVGTPTALFRSTDNGTTWSTANTGIEGRWVLAFAASGSTIFAGTADKFAVSTNNGTTWVAAEEGLTCTSPNKWIRSLAVRGEYLFAGTGKDGVWRRPLSELTTFVGSLAITVTNAENWGSPGALARVVLHNNSNAQVAEGPTNASGVVTFADIPVGSDYFYRVYVTDPSRPWGEQFWGEKSGIGVIGGRVTTESFIHNSPYMPAVHVFLNSTNEELSPGGKSPVAPGTALRVELQMKNPDYPGALAVSAHGGLYFDRDQASPYDAHLTTSVQGFAAGTTDTVIFNCTAPAAHGNYYYSVAAYASSARYSTMLTDASGWYDPAFRVETGSDVRDGAVNELCAEYALRQNYPNPFNPLTTIRYGLPQRSHVTLAVFNTLSQQVAQLVQGEVDAGYHEVQFDGSNLASGVYLCRMQIRPLDSAVGRDSKSGAGTYMETKKLLLVK